MPRRLPPLLLVAPLAASLAAAALAPTARAQVPDSLQTSGAPQTAVSLGAPGAAPAADDGPPIVLPVPAAPAAPGGLERPVSYTARDSLRIVLAPRDSASGADGPGDVVSLFGNVEAGYEGATITAGRVDYESRDQALRAAPLAGDTASAPRYRGEEGEFSGQGFVYNLRTQRGRVTGARTAIQDGYLLGGIIKQQDAHVVFAQDAAYTTCELDHPHYALEAGRIKIVDGETVYTGPVQLKILGIPMPLVLPFGYFPAAQGRRSGPLAVDYGQDTAYGLFLGNVGWYWAISDYLDAQVATKLGTAGSFLLSGAVGYSRRYAYNGNVRLEIGRLRTGESTDPGFAPRVPFGLRWNHNQTFPGGQRLTASVDLQSVSQRQAAEEVSNQIRSTTSSSVSYSQQWPSVGRSLTVSARASQDFVNERTEAQLPQVSFSQQRRFPFRRGRDDRWYEKVSLSYDAKRPERVRLPRARRLDGGRAGGFDERGRVPARRLPGRRPGVHADAVRLPGGPARARQRHVLGPPLQPQPRPQPVLHRDVGQRGRRADLRPGGEARRRVDGARVHGGPPGGGEPVRQHGVCTARSPSASAGSTASATRSRPRCR